MKAGPRSLILITVDCLRADRVATSCNRSAITPFLDSLAGESFFFRNAYASGIPTYYSLPALLASRYPLALGRDVIGIAPGESTIATELKDCGFRTAAFVAGNPYVCSADGYGAGFDVFRNLLEVADIEFDEGDSSNQSLRGRANRLLSKACHNLPGLSAAYDEIYFHYCQRAARNDYATFDNLRRFPSADVLVDYAIAWLEENHASPFFLWLHLMDPHAPYYPKAEALEEMGSEFDPSEARHLNSLWAREGLSSRRLSKNRESVEILYDAGVRWADRQIARLATRLVELNLWNQCALAVTADHGEEFLDHGGKFHPPVNLHEELIRVPLLMRVPGHPQSRDVKCPIGLIDLPPTLFDALDIPAPATFRGRSCWQKLKNSESWDWPVFTECAYGCTNPFRAETRLASRVLSVRKGDYKLIMNFSTGSDRLFKLGCDLNEMVPLPQAPESGVRKQLLDYAKKHLTESLKSRDLDLRFAAQARELRSKWTQSIAVTPN
ncbi:MAG TPA: sulfatase [Terriglobales bacterium]|nr:sulfatase [Terriglobales bacterium]